MGLNCTMHYPTAYHRQTVNVLICLHGCYALGAAVALEPHCDFAATPTPKIARATEPSAAPQIFYFGNNPYPSRPEPKAG